MKPIPSSVVAVALLAAWSRPAAAQEVRVATVSAAEYVPIENRYPLFRYGISGVMGFGSVRQLVAHVILAGAQVRVGYQFDPGNAVYWEAMPAFGIGSSATTLGVDNVAVYEHTFGRFILGLGVGASIAGYIKEPATVNEDASHGPLIQAPMGLVRVGILIGHREDESHYDLCLDFKPFPMGGTNGVFLTFGWDRR